MEKDTQQESSHCPVCDNPDLIALEFPSTRCMRSDGLLISEPLMKHHCSNCGTLIGKNSQPEVRYQRSLGKSPYDHTRHKIVADGIARCIEKQATTVNLKVLEVGAANFQTAIHLKKIMPEYLVSALERHPEHIPDASEISIIVDDFFNYEVSELYDVVFSNQVIEHFSNPIDFLKCAGNLVSNIGVVIACCPTFRRASNELLFADHLFHFTAEAMSICATNASLELTSEFVSDWDPLTHVYIFHKTSQDKLTIRKNAGEDGYLSLLKNRREILSFWLKEDNRICELLPNMSKVSIFGAGEFTQLVSAYMPKVWSRIDRLIVDSMDGIREFDRPVFRLLDIMIDESELFLIGAHKTSRLAINNRLISSGVPIGNIIEFAV
jgi:SAM-dependent methyltransferase